MEFQRGTIRYEGQAVHCLKAGNGPRLLLAFHGFYNDASMFLPLVSSLGDRYTLVSVDLPGHGYTRWSLPFFEKKDLMALVQGFKCDKNVETISLIGYSLGGRICLNIIEQQPEWVEEVFLLASDGLTCDIWYTLATRTLWGKRIFRHICRNPERILPKLEWLRKLKLVGDARYKFARGRLSDEGIRASLDYVWPVMSRLIPDKTRIRGYINKYSIPLHLFAGKQDPVFPSRKSKRFISGLKSAHLHVIDTGHNFVKKEVMLAIARIIRQTTS